MKTNKLQKGYNKTLLTTIFPFVAFLALGLFVMKYGHLHEDAYILFIYSENLSNYGSISYFAGGPPAEGATDFLWMVFIAALNYIGFSSGISALLLNSLGAILFFSIVRCICSKNNGSVFSSVSICFYILLSPISIASYGGFSTLLFCSIIALIMYIMLFKEDRNFLFVAPAALILALIRPDGAVIAAGFVVVSLFIAPKNLRKTHCILVAVFAILCSLYFIWRWRYFGEFLPLPLIVKSSSDEILPGLRSHLSWLLMNFTLFSLAILGLLIQPWKHFIRFLYVCAPIALYFALTSLTIHSQNVGNRFQAPILVPMLISGTIAMSYFFPRGIVSKKYRRDTAIAIFIALTLTPTYFNSIRNLDREVAYLTNTDYINFFPYHLNHHLSAEVSIALTEAGRLAYWTKGEKYDLVGLNTAETAVNGSSPAYVSDLSPDIVMAHQAGLLPDFQCPSNLNFCRVSSKEFTSLVQSHNVRDYLSSENRVIRAFASAATFLSENDTYEIYFVRYGSRFSHIYGVMKNGNVNLEDFEEALSVSHSEEGRVAYFDLIAP